MLMEIVRKGPKATLTALETNFDSANAVKFKEKCNNLLNENVEDITIDLHKVEFMDSTALGALIAIRRHVKAVTIHLVGLNPAILELLQITQADKIFDINPIESC